MTVHFPPGGAAYAAAYLAWHAAGQVGARPGCHAFGVGWEAAALIRWGVGAELAHR